MSINSSIKFLRKLKQGIKRIISWNKYRYETITQPKLYNLIYLIDPTFRNINSLFVISFKNGDGDPTIDSFDNYYILLIEIKHFNALIDNKPFFDQSLKNRNKKRLKNY